MFCTQALTIVLFIGISAVSDARGHFGKALGRASLATNSLKGVERVRQIPINTRVGRPQEDEIVPYEILSDTGTESPSITGTTPCQTAPQWEGRGSEWDHIRGNNNRFNISFDGLNRRKRIIEDKHAQQLGKRIYEYIMLYDEGIQYVINHNNNTCKVEPIGTWRNHTIPPKAILEDSYEIGAPGGGSRVQEWSDRIIGRQKERWIGTYTDPGCWPIMEIFMERDSNKTMVKSVSTRFFDLKAGIEDMSVFTPPSYCNQPTTATPPSSPEPKYARQSRIRPPVPRRLRPISRRVRPEVIGRVPKPVDRLPLDRLLQKFLKSGDLSRIPEGMDRATFERFLREQRVRLGSLLP